MTEQMQAKDSSFFEKNIMRWCRIGEGRVLLESYLLCSIVPVLFYILPEWIMVSNGRIHREGLVDYSMGPYCNQPILLGVYDHY